MDGVALATFEVDFTGVTGFKVSMLIPNSASPCYHIPHTLQYKNRETVEAFISELQQAQLLCNLSSCSDTACRQATSPSPVP